MAGSTAFGVQQRLEALEVGPILPQPGLQHLGAAADGVVEYAWAAGDTDTAGTHLAEFQVTFPGGLPATYPNRGYLLVEITADL